MATSRVTMTPVSINQFALSTPPSAIGAVAPGTGIDAAGANGALFATAWPGAAAGSQFLWGYNGATACSAYVLIGQKAGGQVEPYTTYTIVLPTTGYFWIGPVSPSQYTQQDASQFVSGTGNGGIAPGGQILTTGVGFTCIDFSATGTVAVRLYQCGTVTP